MPLTDLVRYFNTADQADDGMLYLDEGRAAAWHKGLRLASLFQPIVDLRTASIVGHQASLQARREDGTPVSAVDAYASCETAESLVHFDRLCRTLHALNFLAQQRHAGGYLQLPVHSRHLLAVPSQHGLVYEAILKRCGLAPDDIVLEIDAARLDQPPQVAQAIKSYHLRGYRLALSGLAEDTEIDALAGLKPAILKFRESTSPALRERAHQAGLLVQFEGVASTSDYANAREQGFDLASGSLFGPPQARCHATHNGSRVAYNSPSPIGVRP